MQHALGDGVRTRGTVREILGESAAFFGEAVRWHHPVDEALGRQRLRRQDGSGEYHLGSARGADPRCDALGSAGVRDAAGHCLDLADLADLGSPDEIARKAYLKGARVALAVYQR